MAGTASVVLLPFRTAIGLARNPATGEAVPGPRAIGRRVECRCVGTVVDRHQRGAFGLEAHRQVPAVGVGAFESRH